MPDGVGVSSALNDQKLTLSFNAGLTFDLADAKLAAPSNVASINQKLEGDTSAVEIALIGDVDVHSFREDKNYIVDVAFQQAEKPSALSSPAPDASHAPAPAAPAISRLRRCSRSGSDRAGRVRDAFRPTCGAAGDPAKQRRQRRSHRRTGRHRGQTGPGAESIARLRGAEARAPRAGSAGVAAGEAGQNDRAPSRRLKRKADDRPAAVEPSATAAACA